MDKRKGFLNVSASLISRLLLFVGALLVRRFLIRYIGNEANGLNSLFSDIIGVLDVAELGVGRAIVYSMYAPIVAEDEKKIAGLYCLYKKAYRVIGSVIFAAGLIVMPFLPRLINDYAEVNVNVYLAFFLTLSAVVISYVYSAKTSLIEAHKDNFINTGIATVSRMIRCVLQIAAILIWKSYIIFLICQIIETIIIWILTEIIVKKRHGKIVRMHEDLDLDTKKLIGRNIRAMFMHKIGTVLVNMIDSIIISGFIGVVVLGKYSNYTAIAVAVSGAVSLFFSPLTSVVGHLCAAGDKDETKRYFDLFYYLNYMMALVLFLGFYAVADGAVSLLFGDGLNMSRTIVFVITLNRFTFSMRNTPLLFRNASGTYYNDRFKPVAEGVANLILSLLFVNIFPEDYRVVGVIAATIMTTLFICDTVEPYVVFHHVFDMSPKVYYIRNYLYTGIFIACVFIMNICMRPIEGNISYILVNGLISVGISLSAIAILYVFDRGLRASNPVKKLLTFWR